MQPSSGKERPCMVESGDLSLRLLGLKHFNLCVLISDDKICIVYIYCSRFENPGAHLEKMVHSITLVSLFVEQYVT